MSENLNKTSEEGEFYSSSMIFTKSSNGGTDSKGRNKLALILDEDQTKQLIEAAEYLKSNDKRAKLQIHYTDDNAFFFIKEVQPKGAAFSGGKSANKPARGASMSPSVKEKIKQMQTQG